MNTRSFGNTISIERHGQVFWWEGQDSNSDYRVMSPACYHYTTLPGRGSSKA